MIVFFAPQGGLGNLVFQYQAMIKHCDSATRFVMPKTILAQVFELDRRCLQLPIPNCCRLRLIGYWNRGLSWLANVGILSLMEPEVFVVEGSYVSETLRLQFRPGWFKAAVFRGFFQSRSYATPAPRLLPRYVDMARLRLAKFPEGVRVAVHLRFGDYRDWSILGKRGVVLPQSFYSLAMNQIRRLIEDPCFVVISDDLDSAKKILEGMQNVHYYKGESAGEDLAAMSLCEHAIVSASTFAWWGASLINGARKIVIAPRFWLGFKSYRWFPATMEDPNLMFITVPESAGGD